MLSAPEEVFADVRASGRGFGALFGLLALELLLVHPLPLASHLMRLPHNPAAALLGVWQAYVHYALPAGVGVFMLGLALYYRLRGGERRLEPWAAASLLAYAWTPHLVLVATGVLAAAAGLDHPLLPQHRFGGLQLGAGGLALKAAIAFAPSAYLAARAVRFALGRPATPFIWAGRGRPIAAAALLLVGAGLAATSQTVWRDWRSVRPLLPGDALPGFAVRGLDAPTLTRAELDHQVVLVDFWASWCGPCVEAMPKLAELHRALAPRGFRLLSINAGDESDDEIRRFVSGRALDFPIYVDDGRLQHRFQVQSLPTAFLVDRHGAVRRAYYGALSAAALRADVEELLDEPDDHH